MAIKTIKKHIELKEKELDKLEQEHDEIKKMIWKLEESKEYKDQLSLKRALRHEINELIDEENNYVEKATYHSREALEDAAFDTFSWRPFDLSFFWFLIEGFFARVFYRNDDINIVADILVRICSFSIGVLSFATVVFPVVGLLALAHHKIEECRFDKKAQKVKKERKVLEEKFNERKFPLVEKLNELKDKEEDLFYVISRGYDKYNSLYNANKLAQKIATKKKLVMKNKETKQTTENTYINQEENVM